LSNRKSLLLNIINTNLSDPTKKKKKYYLSVTTVVTGERPARWLNPNATYHLELRTRNNLLEGREKEKEELATSNRRSARDLVQSPHI
jgi:hypothetical protein